MKTYNCKICKYSTKRKHNMAIHYTSKKHCSNMRMYCNRKSIVNNTKSIVNNTYCIENKEKISKKLMCEFCHKNISHNNNVKKHYSVCKKKLEYDIVTEKNSIIKKLEDEKKRFEEENKQLIIDKKESDMELKNFMKEVAMSKSGTIVYNNSVNMFHILHNYKNVKNYDDIMGAPLSDKEEEYLIKMGAAYTPGELIEMRCITNLRADQRSIHCVDVSRDKYLVRNNDTWNVDNKGKMIMEATFPIVNKLFLDNAQEDMNELAKNNDIDGITKAIYNQDIATKIVNHKKDKEILDKYKNKLTSKNIQKKNIQKKTIQKKTIQKKTTKNNKEYDDLN